jgi:hypothetical protein
LATPCSAPGPRIQPQHLADGLAVLRLVRGQRVVRHLHEGHLGAEAVERLRQLQPDRTGAQHHHRARRLGGLDGLPVGPEAHLVEAVDRRAGGLAAGGDEDPAAGLEAPPVDLDGALADDSRLPAQEGAALGLRSR